MEENNKYVKPTVCLRVLNYFYIFDADKRSSLCDSSQNATQSTVEFSLLILAQRYFHIYLYFHEK